MMAPVYRNLEQRSTMFGLTMPFETGVVLALPFLLMGPLGCGPFVTVACVVGVWGIIQLVNHGRAPGFLQHFAVWQIRRRVFGGRVSAAARSKRPQFPFGEYLYRDVPARRSVS